MTMMHSLIFSTTTKLVFFRNEIWNVYQREWDGLPCTNNSVEGFHSAQQGSVNALNPTIWKIISSFKSEESPARKKKTDAINGIYLSKKKCQDVNAKIYSIVVNFNPTSAQDYLKNIAACMHSF